MKHLIKALMLIAFNLTFGTTYCQDTNKILYKGRPLPLKENNHILAEALECKDLIVEKNQIILYQDSLIKNLDTIKSNALIQINLLTTNAQIFQTEQQITRAQYIDCQKRQDAYIADANKAKIQKNKWKKAAFIEGGVIVGIGALLYLIH